TGAYLLFSTFIGGGGSEVATAVVNSNASGPVLAGLTSSADLPVTQGALQSTNAGGPLEGFVNRLATCTAFIPFGSCFPETAGCKQVGITAAAGCAWYATVDQPWVTFTTGSGIGNNNIAFSVAANNGPLRTATINVLGQSYVITQVAGCYVTLGSSGSWFSQS